jgi:hypothetical protein
MVGGAEVVQDIPHALMGAEERRGDQDKDHGKSCWKFKAFS